MVSKLALRLKRRNYLVAVLVFMLVLVIDQIIKIEVKTGMALGERIWITDWFQLVFVENPGMAFGWELGGKTFLTLFRLVAVGLIGWFMCRVINRGAHLGFVVCLSLIMAGAAGNIIDSLFYGMVFDDPSAPVHAQYVGWGNGYSEVLKGKVVDMFYFPLVEWDMPEWMPIYSGEHCVFFSPIFNFADAAISCGVVALIIFFPKTLNKRLGDR